MATGKFISNRTNFRFKQSVALWNPFTGCNYNCSYCEVSFKRLAKRLIHYCASCSLYLPHEHRERLGKRLDPTIEGRFITACGTGDISFASPEYRDEIFDVMRKNPGRTFFLQTKNPACLYGHAIPWNCIVGTTIETNRDIAGNFSEAPLPETRYRDLLGLGLERTIVSLEPLMDFDSDILFEWILNLRPVLVLIGYETRAEVPLPEPPLAQVKEFIDRLKSQGITVSTKVLRDARYFPYSSGNIALP